MYVLSKGVGWVGAGGTMTSMLHVARVGWVLDLDATCRYASQVQQGPRSESCNAYTRKLPYKPKRQGSKIAGTPKSGKRTKSAAR